MNLSEVCTVFLFVLISCGIQFLNLQIFFVWILTKSNYDWLIIPVVIFLWNVIAPVLLVYKLLLERGLL